MQWLHLLHFPRSERMNGIHRCKDGSESVEQLPSVCVNRYLSLSSAVAMRCEFITKICTSFNALLASVPSEHSTWQWEGTREC